MKPNSKPENPNFSSGPCSKRPDYDVRNLSLETLGRSHRSALGKEVLGRVCTETAELLGLPPGYRVGVVPASDTGAVEMALWSLLGERPVDVFSWESFGKGWLLDIMQQLNEREGSTFIFSTHDPRVIERARRVIIFEDGHITEDRSQ